MIDTHPAVKALGGGLSVLLLLATAASVAHEGKDAEPTAATGASAAAADVKLFDLELINQHGRAVKFRSDVIGERVVVMNFIYTSCTTVCPVSSAIFGQVQERLGEHLGKDVFLVSVSVDPVTDRPARLRAYAQKHNAGEGWIWLTGNKLAVDKVLDGLGVYTANYDDHPATVLIGDGRTGRWTRLFGFPSPDRIMTRVDALIAARTHTLLAAPKAQ